VDGAPAGVQKVNECDQQCRLYRQHFDLVAGSNGSIA